jgi:hypothetical protein
MSAIGDDPDDLRIDAVRGPTRTAGIAAVSGPTEVGAADAIQEVHSTAATSSTDEIAHALAAGTLDAETAKARLIEEAVAAQLPPGTDPARAAELRAEVAALLEADPVLARLLRP